MLTGVVVTHDPRAEALFGQWNIAFELREILIDEVRLLDGAQVRDLANIAPSEGVEEYATQMRSGASFPPVVLMKPNILIDGNTRLGLPAETGAACSLRTWWKSLRSTSQGPWRVGSTS